MEKILGATLQRELQVPGTRPGQADLVRYISFSGTKARAVLHEVIQAIKPAIPKSGAVITEPCTLTLPDGLRMFAVSYHGDVPGWERQVTEGAEAIGLTTGRVEGETLVLADGRQFALSECQPHLG